MPQRHCLITGGAGFIGSHLVEHLLSQGDEVTVVDDFSTGRRENLRDAAGVRCIEARLTDALPALADAAPFDEIYHLAAAVGVKRVLADPVDAIRTNVTETIGLLDLASTHATPTLIASSSEVYGKSGESPFRETGDCVYGPTTARRWSYACTKAIDEHLALAHFEGTSLPCVVARFFNVVGPRQVGTYGMVLPNFVGRVLQNQPPVVYGDGEQSRCFCAVGDIVPALPRMLRERTCHGQVFNLGSDEPIAIKRLAELVIEVLGADVRPEFLSYDQAYGPGFEDLTQRQPDISKVKAAIGFGPTISLKQTIRDIADHISHNDSSCPERSGAAT